jgi:hypothetical protein
MTIESMTPKQRASYDARIAKRRRLRAVVGWETKLTDLSEAERAAAEARAAEPLAKVSLAAIAKRCAKPHRLVFAKEFAPSLIAGCKRTTIRKLTRVTDRLIKGQPLRIECPSGLAIGVSEITAIDKAPRLTPPERKALQRIYGTWDGPWVRITFAAIRRA